jgi:hypothetical protein
MRCQLIGSQRGNDTSLGLGSCLENICSERDAGIRIRLFLPVLRLPLFS